MNDAHFGERAALYALGALDDAESAALQAHLRICAACAKLVGEAERDVDTIASLETRRRAPEELRQTRRTPSCACASAAGTLVAFCGHCRGISHWGSSIGVLVGTKPRDAGCDALAKCGDGSACHNRASHGEFPADQRCACRRRYVPFRWLVVRNRRTRSVARAPGRLDARRRADDAGRRRASRPGCDALSTQESSHGATRPNGRPARRRAGAASLLAGFGR